jgi:hypothetical protein
VVFFQKTILIPNVAEKNILILVEEKINTNSNSRVVEKKILNETKNHNPTPLSS